MMELLITVATGFIGRALCANVIEQGHALTVLSRRPHLVPKLCGATVSPVSSLDALLAETHFDAMFNLAGEGIADQRWSTQRKQQLLESRIQTTHQLVALIARSQRKPSVLVSGSAVGFYGDQGNVMLNEHSSLVFSL